MIEKSDHKLNAELFRTDKMQPDNTYFELSGQCCKLKLCPSNELRYKLKLSHPKPVRKQNSKTFFQNYLYQTCTPT